MSVADDRLLYICIKHFFKQSDFLAHRENISCSVPYLNRIFEKAPEDEG